MSLIMAVLNWVFREISRPFVLEDGLKTSFWLLTICGQVLELSNDEDIK